MLLLANSVISGTSVNQSKRLVPQAASVIICLSHLAFNFQCSNTQKRENKNTPLMNPDSKKTKHTHTQDANKKEDTKSRQKLMGELQVIRGTVMTDASTYSAGASVQHRTEKGGTL